MADALDAMKLAMAEMESKLQKTESALALTEAELKSEREKLADALYALSDALLVGGPGITLCCHLLLSSLFSVVVFVQPAPVGCLPSLATARSPLVIFSGGRRNVNQWQALHSEQLCARKRSRLVPSECGCTSTLETVLRIRSDTA